YHERFKLARLIGLRNPRAELVQRAADQVAEFKEERYARPRKATDRAEKPIQRLADTFDKRAESGCSLAKVRDEFRLTQRVEDRPNQPVERAREATQHRAKRRQPALRQLAKRLGEAIEYAVLHKPRQLAQRLAQLDNLAHKRPGARRKTPQRLLADLTVFNDFA